MNKGVIDTIGAVVIILVGIGFTIYHKPLGIKAGYYNPKFMKLFHIQIEFSEATIRGIQIMFLIIGIFFVIFGFLSIFHVIKFK